MTSLESDVDCVQQITTAGPEIDAVMLVAAMPTYNTTVTCTSQTDGHNRAACVLGPTTGHAVSCRGCNEVQ
jgi:hypothetical protein